MKTKLIAILLALFSSSALADLESDFVNIFILGTKPCHEKRIEMGTCQCLGSEIFKAMSDKQKGFISYTIQQLDGNPELSLDDLRSKSWGEDAGMTLDDNVEMKSLLKKNKRIMMEKCGLKKK